VSEDLQRAIDAFRQLDDKRSDGSLGPDEELAWVAAKERIERLTAPGEEMPPSSRRHTLRVPTTLHVTFENERGFERAYLRNISEGGVYVATSHPLKMGDRFRLTMLVDASGEALELPVEVVWVNRNPSPGSGLEPGVGVAWLELASEQKTAIKAILRRALDDLARA
jgi:uncharacterized protein (TIGR02266 family)